MRGVCRPPLQLIFCPAMPVYIRRVRDGTVKRGTKRIDVSSCMDLPLFEGITEEDLKSLLVCMRAYVRSFSRGEIIVLEEQKIRYVGMVLHGSVNMLKEDFWGNETLLTYLKRGELCGENYAIQKDNASHVMFQASSASELLFIPAANIIHTCPRQCGFHAKIAENLFGMLGRKADRLMQRIEVASKPTLRDKILAYLSELAQEQNSRYIEIPISRTELAGYLNANRSAMTRELAAMRRDGLIEFDRNTFQLKV